jgi:hypothetical protein
MSERDALLILFLFCCFNGASTAELQAVARLVVPMLPARRNPEVVIVSREAKQAHTLLRSTMQ